MLTCMLYYDIFILSKDKERNEIMKKYLWVVYPIFTIMFLISSIYKVNVARERTIEKFDKDYKESKKVVKSGKNVEFDSSLEIPSIEGEMEDDIEEQRFEPIGLVEPEIQEKIQIETQEHISDSYTTRMTSYYPEEGETTTASGLGINNFQTNDKGWFTYNGKLVVATASTRLGYTNMRTYSLYDEVTLNIDGIDYQAIVLDVCGACQRSNRIDLFVSSVRYAKDTMINVRRK